MVKTIHVTAEDDLQTVFDSAPENSIICFAPGEYRQKTMIRTPGLTLIGAGAEETKIVYDDYALKKDEQGRDYVTFRTYTLAVCAPGVTMKDLSIVNDALDPQIKGQEVALTVYADDFSMENCRLTSTQDTLFLGPLPPDLIERYDGFLPDELRLGGEMRQRFTNCLIEGTVDFIFGCGDAVFENCEIRSLQDARDLGFVAAPAHSLEQTRGIRFCGCRFTCGDGVTPGSIFLARPWRDYGLATFENSTYGPHIAPEGFDKWNDTRRDLTARFHELPLQSGRVAWINRDDGKIK